MLQALSDILTGTLIWAGVFSIMQYGVTLANDAILRLAARLSE